MEAITGLCRTFAKFFIHTPLPSFSFYHAFKYALCFCAGRLGKMKIQ